MIKINLICMGDIKEKYLREAIAEYIKRISRFADLKIIELKEIFMKNYKSINFFGFKSAELNNKEEISKILLEIIKSLTLKIKELKD